MSSLFVFIIKHALLWVDLIKTTCLLHLVQAGSLMVYTTTVEVWWVVVILLLCLNLNACLVISPSILLNRLLLECFPAQALTFFIITLHIWTVPILRLISTIITIWFLRLLVFIFFLFIVRVRLAYSFSCALLFFREILLVIVEEAPSTLSHKVLNIGSSCC